MIVERFHAMVRRYPDEVALVDGEERLTYADLEQGITALAFYLKRTLDVRPGDVIAASLSNSWQFVESFFATVKLGASFFPCNPQWRAPELRALASRLRVRGAIVEKQSREEWDELADLVPSHRLLSLEERPRSIEGSVEETTLSEDQPVVWLTTSGSTGTPRLVPRSARNLFTAAANVANALKIDVGRRFLGVGPFYHAYGFNNCLMLPLLSGARTVPVRQFVPATCIDLIDREKIDVLFGSPLVYDFLARNASDSTRLASLAVCLSGGARMAADIAERWNKRFGIPVRQYYGSTETGVIAIDRGSSLRAPDGQGTYVGTPIPGVEARCLAADGADAPAGSLGEIIVKSGAVMSGYLDEPEASAQAFYQGFYRTGDVGFIDGDGGLFLTGRIGRTINIGGVKVAPAEIERVIETIPVVSQCWVDGAPHPSAGETIRARIVLREGASISRAELLHQCRQQLAEYKLPRIIEFVEALPMSISGKLSRFA